ncbi:MAG: HAD family hydrolase, partial [Deltaproteobacteria bacterium]|nr:HAD family hydrolase [Deltaproteobacteria bacterium]
MNRLRAVFFDLGGTLFSNRQIPEACMPVLQEAADRLAVEGGLPAVGRAFVEATQTTNADYVGRAYYLHRDLFLDTVRQMLGALDVGEPEGFIEWFYRSQRAVVTSQMVLREDCLETLSVLRSRGLHLSIVSNIDDDFLEPMMEKLGLAAYFDHWTSSESARSCKPDSGIFEHAMLTAACAPEEALFVGDSRVHDIQGASRAGIRSALLAEGGFSHLDDPDLVVDPDYVIKSLSELL